MCSIEDVYMSVLLLLVVAAAVMSTLSPRPMFSGTDVKPPLM